MKNRIAQVVRAVALAVLCVTGLTACDEIEEAYHRDALEGTEWRLTRYERYERGDRVESGRYSGRIYFYDHDEFSSRADGFDEYVEWDVDEDYLYLRGRDRETREWYTDKYRIKRLHEGDEMRLRRDDPTTHTDDYETFEFEYVGPAR